MKFIPWKAEYETGIEEVDNHHKLLFKLINFFGMMNVKQSNQEDIMRALSNLAEQTIHHFGIEETLMGSQEYLLFDHHKSCHLVFKRLIDELIIKIKAEYDLEKARNEIYFICSQWIVEHILKEDLEMSIYLDKSKLIDDRNFQGASIEITRLNNDLLGIGLIEGISKGTALIRVKGNMKIHVKVGERIKLNVFNFKFGFQVWEGAVVSSDMDELVVTNVVRLAESNKRNFIRIKTDIEAKLESNQDSDMSMHPLYEIKIEDLSLCGLGFSSLHKFSVGDQLSIYMLLYETSLLFECTVVRIISNGKEGGHYGCQFKEYSESQASVLEKFILENQRVIKK